jgi:hypothetical protein
MLPLAHLLLLACAARLFVVMLGCQRTQMYDRLSEYIVQSTIVKPCALTTLARSFAPRMEGQNQSETGARAPKTPRHREMSRPGLLFPIAMSAESDGSSARKRRSQSNNHRPDASKKSRSDEERDGKVRRQQHDRADARRLASHEHKTTELTTRLLLQTIQQPITQAMLVRATNAAAQFVSNLAPTEVFLQPDGRPQVAAITNMVGADQDELLADKGGELTRPQADVALAALAMNQNARLQIVLSKCLLTYLGLFSRGGAGAGAGEGNATVPFLQLVEPCFCCRQNGRRAGWPEFGAEWLGFGGSAIGCHHPAA